MFLLSVTCMFLSVICVLADVLSVLSFFLSFCTSCTSDIINNLGLSCAESPLHPFGRDDAVCLRKHGFTIASFISFDLYTVKYPCIHGEFFFCILTEPVLHTLVSIKGRICVYKRIYGACSVKMWKTRHNISADIRKFSYSVSSPREVSLYWPTVML